MVFRNALRLWLLVSSMVGGGPDEADEGPKGQGGKGAGQSPESRPPMKMKQTNPPLVVPRSLRRPKKNRRLGCGDGARLARFWAQRRIVNSGRYCEQDKIRCGVDAVTSQGVNCSVGATHALPNGAFRAALVWSGLDVWLHGYRGMSLGFRSRSFPRLPESVDGLGAEMNLLLNIF
ncbi:hypothetical protein E4U23_002483 [Claviceps purpurea]|nr:hypothetical protein E4U23_002483 [Claviceps purpurea]